MEAKAPPEPEILAPAPDGSHPLDEGHTLRVVTTGGTNRLDYLTVLTWADEEHRG